MLIIHDLLSICALSDLRTPRLRLLGKHVFYLEEIIIVSALLNKILLAVCVNCRNVTSCLKAAYTWKASKLSDFYLSYSECLAGIVLFCASIPKPARKSDWLTSFVSSRFLVV